MPNRRAHIYVTCVCLHRSNVSTPMPMANTSFRLDDRCAATFAPTPNTPFAFASIRAAASFPTTATSRRCQSAFVLCCVVFGLVCFVLLFGLFCVFCCFPLTARPITVRLRIAPICATVMALFLVNTCRLCTLLVRLVATVSQRPSNQPAALLNSIADLCRLLARLWISSTLRNRRPCKTQRTAPPPG